MSPGCCLYDAFRRDDIETILNHVDPQARTE